MKTIQEQYMAEEVYGTPTESSIFWPELTTTQHPLLSSPPNVVVLGLWPRATDDQVELYTKTYKALYPSAKQVVFRYSKDNKQVRAASDALLRSEEKSPFGTALLHVFGNEAAEHLCRLLYSHRLRTGQNLPIGLFIVDEAPSCHFSSLRSPRQLSWYLCAELWTSLVAVCTLGRSSFISDELRRSLHDPALVPAEAKRCYYWRERKQMIYTGWSDGEVEVACREYACEA